MNLMLETQVDKQVYATLWQPIDSDRFSKWINDFLKIDGFSRCMGVTRVIPLLGNVDLLVMLSIPLECACVSGLAEVLMHQSFAFPLTSFFALLRNSLLSIFPIALFGISSINTTPPLSCL